MSDYVSLAYSLFLMNSVRTQIFPGGILIEQSFVSQKTENQPNLHNSPLQCYKLPSNFVPGIDRHQRLILNRCKFEIDFSISK